MFIVTMREKNNTKSVRSSAWYHILFVQNLFQNQHPQPLHSMPSLPTRTLIPVYLSLSSFLTGDS